MQFVLSIEKIILLICTYYLATLINILECEKFNWRPFLIDDWFRS